MMVVSMLFPLSIWYAIGIQLNEIFKIASFLKLMKYILEIEILDEWDSKYSLYWQSWHSKGGWRHPPFECCSARIKFRMVLKSGAMSLPLHEKEMKNTVYWQGKCPQTCAGHFNKKIIKCKWYACSFHGVSTSVLNKGFCARGNYL